MRRSQDVVELLSGLKLFADLGRPELEAAAHTLEEQWFTPGERILRRGLTGSGFYLIAEGRARVQLEGKDLAVLERGDFFGEISILLGESPVADVVAETELSCLVLAGPMLSEFLTSHPKVMYRLLQAEAARLRDALKWRS